MRKGIKFHDGTDMNAEAVKFNIQRHIDDTKSVRNADVKDITSIETPDASTVRITLKGPFAPFISKLTGGAGTILSPAAVAKLGEGLQRELTGAGTGSFKFTEWKKDTQMSVDRNDGYWLKDADGSAIPYLDKIVYKPFPDENVRLTNLKTGEADALIGNPPYKDVADLKKDANLVFKEIPGFGFSFAMMNTEKEPFNTPAARRAFSYAIDREQIKKVVFFDIGKVLDSPIPETIPWAYEKDNRPYIKRDIAKAKQELAAAGKPSGFKFTLQIQNNSPQIQQTAELMKDQIKEAGLDMTIELVEFGTLVQNGNAGNYQAGLIGWSGGIDPDNNLYNLWYTKAGFNLSKYSNPQFDKLLDEGRTTLEQAKRATIYKQAIKIFLEDQPFFIYFNPPNMFVHSKKVQAYPANYNGYWGAVDFDKMWKQK
jgi:peptide/nickel transport system substrate-binding protein